MTSMPHVQPLADAAASQQTPQALLQEVFSSVQGEGIHVGRRQVFVRFAHCHLKCRYCDTAMSSEDGRLHVETMPGQGKDLVLDNPVSPEDLLNVIDGLLTQARHHSVSFTGGEPLLYHRFLRHVFPEIQKRSRTYLETSGTQPEFLAEVLPWTDIIAMDIKLPSATGERAYFDEHRAFLDVAASRPETAVFLKLVFGPDITESEMAAIEAAIPDCRLPLILQPVTSLTDRQVHLDPRRLFAIEQRLSQTFKDVRVIPQTHKMLNIL